MAAKKNTQSTKTLSAKGSQQKSKTLIDGMPYIKGREWYVITGLLALLLITIFHQYIFLNKVFVFKDIGSDTTNQLYPWLMYIRDCLQNGGFPDWTFYQGLGQNIYPTNGINEPFLLSTLLLSKESLLFGIAFGQIVRIFLTGIFFYLYLRLLTDSQYTAIIGAICFAFAGSSILLGTWYFPDALYTALLLYSFELGFKKNQWLVFPLAVAFLASYQLFYLYLHGVFMLFYLGVRLADEQYSWKRAGLLLARLIGFGVIGVAMSAFFSLNFTARMLDSPRGVGGAASYSNTLRSQPVLGFAPYENTVTAILRLFSNDMLGTGSNFKGAVNYFEAPAIYCGLLTLLLVPQVFVFLSTKAQRIAYGIGLAFCIVPIVFPFFRYSIWLFTGDYYRGFSSLIVVFLLVFAFQSLRHIVNSAKIHLFLLLGTLGLLIILLVFPYINGTNPAETGWKTISVLLLLVYTGLLYALSKPSLRAVAQPLLIILVCIEAATFAWPAINKREAITANELQQRIGYNDYTVDAVAYLHATDKGFFRVDKDYFSGLAVHSSTNDGQAQGYQGTSAYHSFNQPNHVKFLAATGVIDPTNEYQTRWLPNLISRPMLQSLCGVKYVFSKNPQNAQYWLQAGYEPIKQCTDVTIYRNPFVRPLGFTYDAYITESEFRLLSNPQKDAMLLKAFVVADNQVAAFQQFRKISPSDTVSGLTRITDVYKQSQTAQQDSLRLQHFSQNNIKATIEVRQKKLLYFSIPFDKGWKLLVNGSEREMSIVNIGFMGAVLEAGQHTIELQYTPPYKSLSINLSLIGSGVYLGFLIFFLTLAKRKEQSTVPASQE